MLAGTVQPKTAYVKVTPPTATLLTRAGPYADIIDFGQRRKRELNAKILNVSICAGFVTRTQPMFFEHLGLDIGQARTVIVKSRGHFRAGFEPWFTPDRVLEIYTPGFSSPILNRSDWKGLPRPVYPLDEDTEWAPPQV